MRPGTTVDGRFEIEARAGAGGMGVVFRARDKETTKTVALKVLHVGQPSDRFEREAETLSQLSHPAVVRYVAHGATSDGRPYIAMEWIDGSSLAELLAERALGVGEALTVVRRVAEGLAAIHAHGVVHRDVKPSNIHLPGGSLADAKIIDLGVARRRFDPHITESGLLVGTLAYMSPEQASGDPNVGPASDVFSLGCVLYKCLTGESPFFGGDATAVLAKVLLEDPAPVREHVPSVPDAVDELTRRMLRKTAEGRPRDAEEVLLAIDGLGDVARLPSGPPPDPALTAAERRVVWVVLIGNVTPEDTETRDMHVSELEAVPGQSIDACIAKYGGRHAVLADRTGVATFTGSGAPIDEAVRAVRAGLELREIAPDSPIAVAMGLSVVGQRVPVGQAIDRGARELALNQAGSLRIDALTARLVGTRFTVEADAAGLYVSGERRGADATRKLLGRPTPCVGRDRELATLEGLFDECASEPVARVALVIGPAGAGKSRLRYELVRRLAQRGLAVELLMGRADSLSAGAPFALLREAIRRSAGILDGEPLATSRSKLVARLARTASQDVACATAPFIGELARVPFDDDASEALRAARADPTLLGDAMRVAWLDFLGRECDDKPVLIVLEDLHWGDGPTLRFVGAALSTLSDRPLMVLALARPELADLLPGVWKERALQEIRLRPLLRSASEQLVRAVLGEDVASETLGRIVELADGNAFHLEELIRAVAEEQHELPESVLGMVQSRLEALPPEERRLLRAASVFGQRFWAGGVAALTGGSMESALVGLSELTRRELVTERPSSALSDEREYAFRHSLVREAGYAMLTDDDRALGHRLAAAWLERAGEAEPLVLAEHLHRGGEAERAAGWYARAGERALEGNDLPAALERVAQAVACEPNDATRGELGYIEGHARMWLGENVEAERPLQTAIELLPRGSARWFSAVSDLCNVASCLEREEREREALALALGALPDSDAARAAQIACISRVASGRLKAGDVNTADELIARMVELEPAVGALTDVARAWIHHARAARGYYVGDVPAFQREIEAASRAFDAAGDVRNATTDRVNLGYLQLSLGEYERAEAELRTGYDRAERLGLASSAAYALHNLGLAVGYSGRLEAGMALERRAIELARRLEEPKLVGAACVYLSVLAAENGDAPAALEAAHEGIEVLSGSPTLAAFGHAALATALRLSGETQGALLEAERAMQLLGAGAAPEEIEARVRLSYAEALVADGKTELARSTIATARARLLERAERIEDDRLRASFLQRVPEHRQTLALALALSHG